MSARYELTGEDRSRLVHRVAALAAPDPYIRQPEPTAAEIDRAVELAWSMLQAAAGHGYSPEDLALVTSVPAAAWDVVRMRTPAGAR